ncbi:hypothetical protein PCASD_15673 [Puccinia coronata f. sp. avenae]|uniref:Uncharacterized protein n=1 Tax=Puccinia coronata f. sp. avenae TaxID=200324 RepID=A0A2N5SM36_9BASI|nr:hypothetical protein PCASD_15673 [Puccinia coronata f. sp. avenae]
MFPPPIDLEDGAMESHNRLSFHSSKLARGRLSGSLLTPSAIATFRRIHCHTTADALATTWVKYCFPSGLKLCLHPVDGHHCFMSGPKPGRRAKTEDESQLEFERKKCAEEAKRKEAEVKQKIELLDHVRRLEAKTQELNEISLSADIQAKEHELAMRERQMAESKQIELAKLEVAKRMGEESLNEADFARIRRERMKAELLARQSNDHALRELGRVGDQAEFDERMAAHNMPQPPSFRSADGISMPMRGHPPMAGPIPMPGSMSTPGPSPIPNHMSIPDHMPISGPMSMPSHMFMPGPMSMPGHMHVPPSELRPSFDQHGGGGMGLHSRLRGRSGSLSAYPGDIGQRDWGPRNNLRPGQGLHLSDYLDYQRTHPSNRDFRDPNEHIALQMATRAQAELMRRKKIANLDQKAMEHNLNSQLLREMRKAELVDNLRELGLQERQIEAEAAKLAERDLRMNEAQLREERDQEYRHKLMKKGLQEREITEHIRKRQERDREALQKAIKDLERDRYHKDLIESERAIREANRQGKPPPMGIKRPSIAEIKREGLLDNVWDHFQDLNPRLQHEILSMQAHYKPNPATGDHRSRRPSMSSLNLPRLSRAPTPQTRDQILQQMENQLSGELYNRANMRPGSKASSRDHDYGHVPLSRHSSIHQSSNSPGPSRLRSQTASCCPATDVSPINARRFEFEAESREQISRGNASLHDESLSARLQSAALNSEINGGRRSRASSRAGQMNDERPMSRHRADPEPSPLNPNTGRGEANYTSPEVGFTRRSRSNSAAQSHGSSAHSRMMYERPVNVELGQSPAGSERDFVFREEGYKLRNSRPPSRANMSATSYADKKYRDMTDEELSRISTRDLQMLLPELDVNQSMMRNTLSRNNLRPGDADLISPQESDSSQFAENQHAGMAHSNVDTRLPHPNDGRPASTSLGRCSPSTSLPRRSSTHRGPMDSSRSSSRCGAFSNHQSGLERKDSRTNSHHSTSPLNPSNGTSPINTRSLYSMSGRDDLLYGAQNDSGETSSRDECYRHASEDPFHGEVVITEKDEHPQARIVDRLGRVEASSSSRENSHHQPVDATQTGSSDREEMNKAVNNLMNEASRRGANGVVSLRLHDLKDGGYLASGEAVILEH